MTGQGAPFLSLGADVPKVVQQAQPVAMQILTQEAQLPGLEAQNGGILRLRRGRVVHRFSFAPNRRAYSASGTP